MNLKKTECKGVEWIHLALCGVQWRALFFIVMDFWVPRKTANLSSWTAINVGFFFLDPDDIKKLGLGAIWRFGNATGLH